jgi:hypothetical protein
MSSAAHPEPCDFASLPRGCAQGRPRARFAGPKSKGALVLAAVLAACGVKAPPRPPEPERPQTSPPTSTPTPTPSSPPPTPTPSSPTP